MLAYWLMSMLAYCLCKGIVFSRVIAALVGLQLDGKVNKL